MRIKTEYRIHTGDKNLWHLKHMFSFKRCNHQKKTRSTNAALLTFCSFLKFPKWAFVAEHLHISSFHAKQLIIVGTAKGEHPTPERCQPVVVAVVVSTIGSVVGRMGSLNMEVLQTHGPLRLQPNHRNLTVSYISRNQIPEIPAKLPLLKSITAVHLWSSSSCPMPFAQSYAGGPWDMLKNLSTPRLLNHSAFLHLNAMKLSTRNMIATANNNQEEEELDRMRQNEIGITIITILTIRHPTTRSHVTSHPRKPPGASSCCRWCQSHELESQCFRCFPPWPVGNQYVESWEG